MERCHYCGMTYHPMPIYALRIDPAGYDIGELDRLINKYFAYNESWPEIAGLGIEGITARLQAQWPPKLPSPFGERIAEDVAAMILQRCRRHIAGTTGHPLPSRIYICHVKLVKAGDDSGDWDVVQHDGCRKRAEADGYEFREDLTPKR